MRATSNWIQTALHTGHASPSLVMMRSLLVVVVETEPSCGNFNQDLDVLLHRLLDNVRNELAAADSDDEYYDDDGGPGH